MSNVNVEMIESTPTQEILKRANSFVEMTDESGRVFKIKKASLLDRAKIFETLGSVKSEMYMQLVLPLIYVVSIDGVNRPPFSSKIVIEKFLETVGEDGMAAIAKGLVELGIISVKSDDSIEE